MSTKDEPSDLEMQLGALLAGHGVAPGSVVDSLVKFFNENTAGLVEASVVFLEDINELQEDVDALLVAVESERAVSDRLADAISKFLLCQQVSRNYTVKLDDSLALQVVPSESTTAYEALAEEHRAYVRSRQQDAA